MSKDLNITQNNASIPFYPSQTWRYLNADILTATPGMTNLEFQKVFSWIQAFFDTTLTVAPTLAIWSGEFQSDGVTPVLNEVQFAYSGERINIKGVALVSTGTNIRGQTVSSVPIGSTLTTQLTKVIAYGGMY